jgi:hypothetical protein
VKSLADGTKVIGRYGFPFRILDQSANAIFHPGEPAYINTDYYVDGERVTYWCHSEITVDGIPGGIEDPIVGIDSVYTNIMVDYRYDYTSRPHDETVDAEGYCACHVGGGISSAHGPICDYCFMSNGLVHGNTVSCGNRDNTWKPGDTDVW